MNTKTYEYFFNTLCKSFVECQELHQKSTRARKVENKMDLTVTAKYSIKKLIAVIEDFVNYTKDDIPVDCLESLEMMSFILIATQTDCDNFINQFN